MISLGQISAAETRLEHSNPTEIDRLFFQGQVLKASGDFQRAIDIFREVLIRNPQHLNARRELAHTLLLAEQYDAARSNFRRLLEIDPNETMRNGYSNFLTVIAKKKPAGISGYFALRPSTNINRGTDNTYFDTELGQFVISPENRVESGIGYQLGVSGYFRRPLTAESRLVLNWGLTDTVYEADKYDNAVGTLSLTYEKTTGLGGWALSPYAIYTWNNSADDFQTVGARFSLKQRVSREMRVSIDLRHEFRDFASQNYQDGAFNSGQLGIAYQVTPRVSINAGFDVDQSRPAAPHLQYDGFKAFAGITNSWASGLSASFGLEFGQRDYVGDFPLTTSPRRDSFYGIKLSIQNAQINYAGFTPRLSCSYTNNRSNVALYDYSATDCQMTISREF